jgi:peroxidase
MEPSYGFLERFYNVLRTRSEHSTGESSMKYKFKALKYLEERAPDGLGNNLANPTLGNSDHVMVRVTPNSYTDGISDFISRGEPGWIEPRLITNAVMAQPKDPNNPTKDLDIPNSFGINEFFQFFGQFLTHDIAEARFAGPSTPLITPIGGDDGLVFPLNRTPSDSAPGSVREQQDDETSFLDLSQVYGRGEQQLSLLREIGSAKLLTGPDNMLPTYQLISDHHSVAVADLRTILFENFAAPFSADHYAVGDNRANQNASLLTHHLMWVRNHNYHVDQLEKAFPKWSDDEIFNAARALNEAEWQNVVYTEYLSALLGDGAISKYQGYNPSVDPSVINEWTTVAFRFGHDQSNNEFATLAELGGSTGVFTLAQSFGLGAAAQAIRTSGAMDDWVRGQLAAHTQEIDGKVVDGNRNLLFNVGNPGNTLDLEVFDIMRGRDHGVGNYLTLYAGLFGNQPGFNQYGDFQEFATRNGLDDLTRDALIGVYGTIDKADSIVMGLLEKPDGTGMLGETFAYLTIMQFENLRDGDRQFYLERFEGNKALIKEIESTSLADIIERTTGIDHVYRDGFAAHTRKGGTDNGEALDGTDKADLLIALGGADTIKAGAGADDIHAGQGNDKIWGGGDADHFIFEKKSGKDTIYDFDVTKDVIDLSALGLGGALSALLSVQTKGGVTIYLSATDTIELTGVKKHQLSSKNFIFDHDDAFLS